MLCNMHVHMLYVFMNIKVSRSLHCWQPPTMPATLLRRKTPTRPTILRCQPPTRLSTLRWQTPTQPTLWHPQMPPLNWVTFAISASPNTLQGKPSIITTLQITSRLVALSVIPIPLLSFRGPNHYVKKGIPTPWDHKLSRCLPLCHICSRSKCRATLAWRRVLSATRNLKERTLSPTFWIDTTSWRTFFLPSMSFPSGTEEGLNWTRALLQEISKT